MLRIVMIEMYCIMIMYLVISCVKNFLRLVASPCFTIERDPNVNVQLHRTTRNLARVEHVSMFAMLKTLHTMRSRVLPKLGEPTFTHPNGQIRRPRQTQGGVRKGKRVYDTAARKE